MVSGKTIRGAGALIGVGAGLYGVHKVAKRARKKGLGTGWFNESYRHSLAAKGIQSGHKQQATMTMLDANTKGRITNDTLLKAMGKKRFYKTKWSELTVDEKEHVRRWSEEGESDSSIKKWFELDPKSFMFHTKKPENMTNKELLDENKAYEQLGGVGMKDKIRQEKILKEMSKRNEGTGRLNAKGKVSSSVSMIKSINVGNDTHAYRVMSQISTEQLKKARDVAGSNLYNPGKTIRNEAKLAHNRISHELYSREREKITLNAKGKKAQSKFKGQANYVPRASMTEKQRQEEDANSNIKGWKKWKKGSVNLEGTWSNKSGDQLYISRSPTTKEYVVGIRKVRGMVPHYYIESPHTGGTTPIRKFKTKQQALVLAKSYMEKH